MDSDLPALDVPNAVSQQPDVHTEQLEPEPEPGTEPGTEPRPEPEDPESKPETAPKQLAANRYAGWLSTDAGDSRGKRRRFWHVLTADSRLTWFKDTDARTLFDELDSDGSGFLDADEVKELCKKLGKSLNKSDVEAALNAMDADGSGEISFGEFQPWWEAENVKAAKKREAVGSADLSRICEASLDPDDGKKETLQVAILGKTLSLKADDAAAASKWITAFAEETATPSPGVNAVIAGHTSSPNGSVRSPPKIAEVDEHTTQQDGHDHDDEDDSFLDEDEDERRKLAARGRGRRNAHAGKSLEGWPPRNSDNEEGQSNACDTGDGDLVERQPRDGERHRRHRRRKHSKHRSSPKRSRSQHRRSSSRSSRSERREIDLGICSEQEYGHRRAAREKERSYGARRTRYSDAPRYSDSHHAMSRSQHDNYAPLLKGTPSPAIPLRTHTHEYEYQSNAPHVMTSGYHERSIAGDVDEDWHVQTRAPMSTPMLFGSGAVVSSDGHGAGSHLLTEFREGFLPFEQRADAIQKEERAVIIEPGAESDLNKYLRHGWRVKSTQPGTDNAFLVIVEREDHRRRD